MTVDLSTQTQALRAILADLEPPDRYALATMIARESEDALVESMIEGIETPIADSVRCLEIGGLTLVQTCGVCPEQWDAFDAAGDTTGYLRLRHGTFRVDYPDCGAETIYTAQPEGDGCFMEDERARFLALAVAHLLMRRRTGVPPRPTLRPVATCVLTGREGSGDGI